MPAHKSGNGNIVQVDTVLFDLDDTLLDSYDARVGALQTVLTRANISDFTAGEFLASLGGAPFREALADLVKTRGLDNDLFTEYRRVYWFERPGRVRLFPGIRPVLDTLKSSGYKLGIVSSKFRDCEFEGGRIGFRYELEPLDIIEKFSVIIGLEDTDKPKPHPEGIERALNDLGSVPQHTLFIGDSAADLEAAHNAGCWICHAAWGIRDDNIIPEGIQIHFTADSPRALLSLGCLS